MPHDGGDPAILLAARTKCDLAALKSEVEAGWEDDTYDLGAAVDGVAFALAWDLKSDGEILAVACELQVGSSGVREGFLDNGLNVVELPVGTERDSRAMLQVELAALVESAATRVRPPGRPVHGRRQTWRMTDGDRARRDRVT